MVAQLNLFGDAIQKIPDTKKAEPTYFKFYSVLQYDRLKFRRVLNRILWGYKCVKTLSQDEILKLCYIRDEFGKIKRDSDAKHIFRLKTLHKIYNAIAHYIPAPFDLAEGVYSYYGFNYSVYRDEKGIKYKHKGKTYYTLELLDKQAQIKGFEFIPIEIALKEHIKVLKLLKQGVSIENVLKKIRGDRVILQH